MAGHLAKLMLLLALAGGCQVSAQNDATTELPTPTTQPPAKPTGSTVTSRSTATTQPPTTTPTPTTTTPAKPTGLTVTSRTTTSLTVSWTGNASYYQVQYRVPGESFINLSRMTGNSRLINSLTPGQTYEIRVTAYHDETGGVGSISVNLSATIKPSMPTGFTATIAGQTINLSWGYTITHVKDGFTLKCSPNIDACSGSGQTLPADTKTLALNNAVLGQVYNFTLTSFVNISGGRLESEPASVTTEGKPDPPTNLDVASGGSTDVTLTWTEPSNSLVKKYRVHWTNTSSGMSGSKETTSNEKTLTINTLTPGYSYEFHVVSISASNTNSDPSTTVRYTADPSPVTDLRLDVNTSDSLTFTWSNGSGRYDQLEFQFSGPSSEQAVQTNGTNTVTYSNLLADEMYMFSVRTLVVNIVDNTTKYSGRENINSTTMEASSGPVYELKVTDRTNDSISLSWQPPQQPNGDIIGYVVQAEVTNNNSCVRSVFVNCTDCDRKSFDYYKERIEPLLCNVSDVSQNINRFTSLIEYTIEELKPFTLYTLEVYAINTQPPTPTTIKNQTRVTVPGKSEVRITDVTHESINISWTPVSNSTGVIIAYYASVRLEDGTIVEEVKVNAGDLLKYAFTGLAPYTNYTIVVFASNGVYNGTFNETLQRTGQYIPEPVNNLNVTPGARFLSIRWSEPSVINGVIEQYNVTVEDFQRQIVYQNNVTDMMVNVTENIKPYTNYTVSVRAKTEYKEWGDPKTLQRVTTLQTKPSGRPSSFTSVKSKLTDRSITLTWGEIAKEERNGEIVHYKITVAPDGRQRTTSQFTETFTNLSPSRLYMFSIVGCVVLKSGEKCGPAANTNATTKDAALEYKKSISSEKRNLWFNKETGLETTSITFTLTNEITDIFSLVNGDITKYQVMAVAKEYSNADTVPAGTRDPPLNWADTQKEENKDKPYAIEANRPPPGVWNSLRRRKRSVEGRRVIVGADDCDPSENVYCNGRLRSSTNYCIFLRVWTSAGYSDSVCIVTAKTKQDVVPIVAAVVAVVAVLIIVAGIVYVLYKKGKLSVHMRRKRSCDREDPKPQTMEPLPLVDRETPPPKEIRLEDFIEHTDDMHRDQDFRFSQEYQKLRDLSAKHVNHAAVLGANTSKNRWVDILPFDHSRVKLLPADEEEGSDYINANYMPGYTSRREYIATQGPLPGTIDHFWRMIWEQNVSMIVMLTQLVERGRRKCEQYWPDDLEEPATYGDLVVTKRSESILPEYTIRIFDIQMGEITRSVEQFFVSFWPDFGCPDNVSSLLNLVRVVRSHMRPESRGPLVVHCSAGVGRTGTYMAVDRLLQHIQEYDVLDIFNMVLEMREYRCKMVQTEDQYIYIHDCLKEALLTGMSVRYTPDPSANTPKPDDPIYENAGQEEDLIDIALNGVDTEMVAVKMNGDDATQPIIKNTEL